ncbi:MAG: hypothetical protein ABJP48_13545 [Erythrobacter sp.]
MAQTYEFYSERADEAAELAQKADLVNVRERHLRAETTWRGLAEQARKSVQDRARADEERAKRREAEAAAANA